MNHAALAAWAAWCRQDCKPGVVTFPRGRNDGSQKKDMFVLGNFIAAVARIIDIALNLSLIHI